MKTFALRIGALAVAALLMVGVTLPANAAASLVFSTGIRLSPTGPALFKGSDFNIMISALNTLRNQADGTTAGTFTGVFNGTVGATTPSTGVFTKATVSGHVITGATPPVLTSCGGGTPTITGSDTAGLVTMGTSATGCVITFAAAYTTAPVCVVSWIATPLASQSYVTAAASITLTQTSTSSNLAQYVC